MAYQWKAPESLSKDDLDKYLRANYGELNSEFQKNPSGFGSLEDYALHHYNTVGRQQIDAGLRGDSGLRPSYTYLTSSSSPELIAREYRNYIATRGGDNAKNQADAIAFLKAIGLTGDQIDAAYRAYLAGEQPAGAVTQAIAPTFQAAIAPTFQAASTTSQTDGTASRTTSSYTPTQSVIAQQIDPVAAAQQINQATQQISMPEIQKVVAPQASATTFEVPYEQTTAGIMERILSANSPYVRQARTRALESMNDRGLLSSSLAAGAGEEAAIGAAFPIGREDAGLYATQRLANQQALNRMAEANADRELMASRANAEAFNTLGRARYETGLGAVGRMLDSRNRLSEAAVAEEFLRGRMLLTQDLDNLRAARDNAYKTGQMELANRLDREMEGFRMRLAAQIDDKRAARDNAYKTGQMELANRLDKELQSSMALLNAEIASNARKDAAGIQEDYLRLRAQLETGQQERMKAIEHNYLQLRQYSTGATNMMAQLNAHIASVLSNPEIDQANKQGLIDRLIETYNASFVAMSAVFGLEVPG